MSGGVNENEPIDKVPTTVWFNLETGEHKVLGELGHGRTVRDHYLAIEHNLVHIPSGSVFDLGETIEFLGDDGRTLTWSQDVVPSSRGFYQLSDGPLRWREP